jgi:hypothetical protein
MSNPSNTNSPNLPALLPYGTGSSYYVAGVAVGNPIAAGGNGRVVFVY